MKDNDGLQEDDGEKRDYSIPSIEQDEDSGSGTGEPEQFPLKLHRLLEQLETEGQQHIIGWNADGRSFSVFKPKEFASKIMSQHFRRQSKYKSFQRQLNLYAFKRETVGKIKGVYSHDLFVRHNRERCKEMKRERAPVFLASAIATAERESVLYDGQATSKKRGKKRPMSDIVGVQGGGRWGRAPITSSGSVSGDGMTLSNAMANRMMRQEDYSKGRLIADAQQVRLQSINSGEDLFSLQPGLMDGMGDNRATLRAPSSAGAAWNTGSGSGESTVGGNLLSLSNRNQGASLPWHPFLPPPRDCDDATSTFMANVETSPSSRTSGNNEEEKKGEQRNSSEPHLYPTAFGTGRNARMPPAITGSADRKPTTSSLAACINNNEVEQNDTTAQRLLSTRIFLGSHRIGFQQQQGQQRSNIAKKQQQGDLKHYHLSQVSDFVGARKVDRMRRQMQVMAQANSGVDCFAHDHQSDSDDAEGSIGTIDNWDNLLD